MILRDFVYSFIPICVAMDMAGLVPLYLTLTKDLTDEEKQTVRWQALATAFLISIVFILTGQLIFKRLGHFGGGF